MKIVVVGQGGREHALASVLGRTADVITTPGNPGIPNSTNIRPEDLEADLFVIGPEVPLVGGLADTLRAQGKLVFGPGADGAQLEGSKVWMKQLLDDAGVPTAAWKPFSDPGPAEAYLRTLRPPYIVKTDGLAAGKGVLVTRDLDTAIADAKHKLSGEAFGESGRRIVIEEALSGPEVSFFAVCGGSDFVLLPTAQDHKRVSDGDQGPNTGGMGAFSPAPDGLDTAEVKTIVRKTLAELKRRGIDYRGMLFGGLMLTPDGPKVLEYNIRLGDPEAQVVLPRLTSDLAHMLVRAAAGATPAEPTSAGACVSVVLACEGYPEAPRTGGVITGVEEAGALEGITVFHAGTARDGQDRLITAGGRVLNITATGSTVAEARDRAYAAIKLIHFPGMRFRTDIAGGI
ncbi:MAG: Phosphoribosylamine--glycine ligase [Patescibacteria group bacterium]|nr:Phosphoribosylamine--glycine ligase [Patescibacteria group bacterium]